MWLKKLPIEGKRKELKGLTLEGKYCCGKCEMRNHTLLRKVEVEYFISKMTHKPNTLRFWVKM
jgi:hypothetical protein